MGDDLPNNRAAILVRVSVMTEWITGAPKRDNPEERLQIAIVDHLRILAPKNVIWYAVPNGEKRSKRTDGRLKAQGVVSGIADLAFVLPDGRAAFLELKSGVGRLSPAQKAFQDKCASMEVEYAVSSSLDHALSILSAWGAIPSNPKRKGNDI